MSDLQQLPETVELLANLTEAIKKNDLATANQLSTILKNIEDAKKASVEAANARRIAASEHLRFWIPVFVPFIGAIALVATLFLQSGQAKRSADQFRQSIEVQVSQFKETAQIQANSREDTEWRAVLEMAKDTNRPQSVLSLTLLKSFLNPRSQYADSARDIAIVMLGHIPDQNDFNVLFPTIAQQTDWSNLNDLPRISRQLEVLYDDATDMWNSKQRAEANFQANTKYQEQYEQYQLLKQKYDTRIKANPKLAETLRPPVMPIRPQLDARSGYLISPTGNSRADGFLISPSIISPDKLMTNVNINQQHVARVIVEWMRRKDYPPQYRLDLDGSAFYMIDMSQLNFHDAALNDAWIAHCDVKDADFGAVTEYDRSRWPGTAWWRAARVAPNLLAYLQQYYPYSTETSYQNDKTQSVTEYSKEVARLTAYIKATP